MEVVHDRNKQEFKIELDQSSGRKGRSFSHQKFRQMSLICSLFNL